MEEFDKLLLQAEAKSQMSFLLEAFAARGPCQAGKWNAGEDRMVPWDAEGCLLELCQVLAS